MFIHAHAAWHSDSGWLQGVNLQSGCWRSGVLGCGDLAGNVAADVGVCGPVWSLSRPNCEVPRSDSALASSR